MPIFPPEAFDALNTRESALVERYVPAGPPPQPLLVVNVAANGSRLWFGIAALLALGPALRRTAAEGVVAALPHCDEFLAGHSLATYAELVEVVARA